MMHSVLNINVYYNENIFLKTVFANLFTTLTLLFIEFISLSSEQFLDYTVCVSLAVGAVPLHPFSKHAVLFFWLHFLKKYYTNTECRNSILFVWDIMHVISITDLVF